MVLSAQLQHSRSQQSRQTHINIPQRNLPEELLHSQEQLQRSQEQLQRSQEQRQRAQEQIERPHEHSGELVTPSINGIVEVHPEPSQSRDQTQS